MDTIYRLRASSAKRTDLCPGSARATWGMTSLSSPEADRGTRIHAALAATAHDSYHAIPDDIREDVDRMWQYAQSVKPAYQHEIHVERPLTNGTWTGTPDLVFVGSDAAVLIDYKSGWGPQDEAADNHQLAVYACLIAENYGVSEVTAYIITPRGIDPGVLYDADSLSARHQEIEDIHARAVDPGAPRVPGVAQCQFCPAMGTTACPETCKSISGYAATVVPFGERGVEAWTGDEIGNVAVLWKMADKLWEKRVRPEIEKRIASGADIPGVKIGKPGETAKIYDAQRAWSDAVGIPQEVFMDSSTVSLSKLIKNYHKFVTGRDGCEAYTMRQAELDIEHMIGPAIDKTPRKGSLLIGGVE